jgi:hypothetical protein
MILSTLLNPGILFFILGCIASFIHSNLKIPDQIIKFISIYLMMAIGFKGGVSLYTTAFTLTGWFAVIGVLLFSAIVPVYVFMMFKNRYGLADSAAIAATYGSNSTLTFITAAAFLTSIGVSYGGYMTVALVVMELPAIILSIIMYQAYSSDKNHKSLKNTVMTALSDGTIVVMVGSMIIGYLTMLFGNPADILTSFISGDMFTGMLIFFLLYMGLQVGQRLKSNFSLDFRLVMFGIIAPIIHGLAALGFSWMVGMSAGSAFLFIMLCASASYIVAPALIKQTIPDSDESKYLLMSLGLTFPLNIVIGIPVWWAAVLMLL